MTRVRFAGACGSLMRSRRRRRTPTFIGIMFANGRRRGAPEEASQIVRWSVTLLREMEQVEPPPLHPGGFETTDAGFEHGAGGVRPPAGAQAAAGRRRVQRPEPEENNEIADETGIDLVQLSGSEPWGDGLLVNRPAIKVLRPQPAYPQATSSRRSSQALRSRSRSTSAAAPARRATGPWRTLSRNGCPSGSRAA